MNVVHFSSDHIIILNGDDWSITGLFRNNVQSNHDKAEKDREHFFIVDGRRYIVCFNS